MPETIDFGSLSLRFLRDKHDTGGSLDLFELTLQPEGRMPVPHYHEAWEETVYGLSGTIAFTVAGETHELTPGHSLFIPRGVVHGFQNHSGAVAKCLSVLTPGVLGPEYFRELAALLRAGPPDAAKVGEIMRRHGLVPAPPG
ncbi:cupin domain-containing protein [Roseomonas indoligenes]|uniref:Cupin domain-containing protein n=1 Tax=Roseomonas indoligenes TaxID=2820811 RepID=A0A940MQB6_9PROT|nr:cupin domain-containing protein [Pararoseomonas indoligenes]MBP0492048.1 cupin domain-containing protein [Pararoseomonas indoligenes]